MGTTALESHRTPLKAFADWCRRLVTPPLPLDNAETAQIAADVGLSVSDLVRVDLAVVYDLHRVCSFCVEMR